MTTLTRSLDIFDGYEREEEHQERDLEVVQNDLAAVVEYFSEFGADKEVRWAYFDGAHGTLDGILEEEAPQVSADTIQRFAHLQPYDELLGIYLSHLMKKSPDTHFKLVLKDALSELGCRNDGNTIDIHGNVGYRLGHAMESGLIRCYGDADDDVGFCMEGGIIRVFGSAYSTGAGELGGGEIYISKHCLNVYSSGTKVVVGGDAFITKHCSGEISVNGRILGVKINKNLTLYHKGKLIVKNGVWQ